MVIMMETENKKQSLHYDAFISYRHLDPDGFAAEKLHRKLESFRLPSYVAKKHPDLPRKINRVFRDQEELPLASNLADPITEALINSDNLIVICTPKLKESKWCLKEIETFIQHHGREHIFTALVEGEPDESFPEVLLKDEKGNVVEPLAADFRGKDHKEISKKIDTEILRLLAPMFGLNYDELKQRHREQKMRRILTLGGILLAMTTALGIYFGVTAYQIKQQAEMINEQKNKILDQATEIDAQYKKSLERYQVTMAGISETLMRDGRKFDAIYTLLDSMPHRSGASDKPYSANATYALTNICHAYADGSPIYPSINYEGQGAFTTIKISPEGTRLAGLDANKTLYIWETETGKEVMKMDSDTIQKQGFYFLSESELLCVLDYNLMIKNVDTGEEIVILEGAYVNDIIEDSIGEKLVITSIDSIYVYDIESRKISQTIALCEDLNNFSFFMGCFNEDSTEFYAIVFALGNEAMDKIVAYDLTKGVIISETNIGNEGHYTDMCVNGDIVYLTGFVEKNIIDTTGFFIEVDYRKSEIVLSSTLLDNGLHNMCFYADEVTDYIFGIDDNKLYSLDGITGQIVYLTPLENKVSFCISMDNPRQQFVILDNGTYGIYDIATGNMYPQSKYAYEINGKIKSLLYSNKGFFICTNDNTYISLYSRAQSAYMEKIGDAQSCSLFYDNLQVGMTIDRLQENHMTFYDTKDWTEKFTIDTDDNNVALINGGVDGILTYSTSVLDDATYSIYNPETGEEMLTGTLEDIDTISAYGNAFCYDDEEDNLYCYDILHSKKLDIVAGNQYRNNQIQTTVDISPNLDSIVSEKDHKLYLFKDSSGKPVKETEIGNGIIGAVFYSSDAKYVCIYFTNGRIEIYDASTLELESSLYGDKDYITRMMYIPENNYYLLLGYNGVLLDENLEKIAYLMECAGYDYDNKKLTFIADYDLMCSPILSYDQIVERAEEVLGDYESPEWIYQKYSISEE